MRAPDQAQRDAIVSARGVNLSIEAGAGTGKTTLLVSRVLARLEGDVPLPRLAIITFTRKAAAELVARIRTKLGEKRHEAEWAARALDEFDRASIGTTDSFCRNILGDFPWEAGVPPGFALADAVAQSALRDLAWRRRIQDGAEEGRRLLTRLRELGVSTARLRTLADDLLSSRDLPVARFDASAPPDLLDAFGGRLDEVLGLRNLCTDPEDRLLAHLAELEEDLMVARALGRSAGERALLRRAHAKKKYAPAARGPASGKQASWGGKENKERVLEGLRAVQACVDVFLEARGRWMAAQVARWIDGYITAYEEAKRERGLLDFRDLALSTRDLLRRDRRVRRLVASRYDEILMDEVQDTDPLQMEIAFLLASEGDPPEDPLCADLVPGKLFLVGDPKQSIYRFRRADIELYERARAQLTGAPGGEARDIVANFRSHPGVVDFVNRIFEGWMERPEGERWQAQWTALVVGREVADPSETDPRVSLILPDADREREILRTTSRDDLNAEARSELEIDAVVRCIRRMLGFDGADAVRVPDGEGGDREARPGDVAVLVRKIAWGDRLLESLRRVGVPAAVAGGKRFHAKEEIRTLLALLEPMVEPDDALARFAALRSPAFGLPDDDLVLHFLDEEDDGDPRAAVVADAVARLDALRRMARELPVPEFLEHLVEELTLLPVFGFRPDGPGRVESLRILLEAADSLVDAGFDSLPAFVRWLREEAREERGEAPGEGEAGAASGVQILTMHKSKGLEFPIVVLADLGSGMPSDRRIVGDRATGRVDFRLSSADAIATPGFEAAAAAEQQRQAAEEVRLLYVAMTRARERLVLSWPSGGRGFLRAAKGVPSLSERIGCEPGEAPPDDGGLGVIRADELPAPESTTRLHGVDPDRLPAPAPGPTLDWVALAADARRGGRVRAATSLASSGKDGGRPTGPALESTAPFHGAAFGTLVHRFLEIHDPAGQSSIVEELRRATANLPIEDAVGFDDAGLAATATWLERVLADPDVAAVMSRIAAGPTRAFREVPFLAATGVDVISGTFDVLVEEPDDTLLVIDWKTDRLGGISGSEAVRPYRSQALVYAWAVARLTGRAPTEIRFLFLDGDPVETGSFRVDEAFLAEAEELVEAGSGGPAGPEANE